jgi:hypothetical protein
MRLISFSVIVSLALLPVAALAQQPAGTNGDTIDHPPPLPGPPPLSEPSTTQSAPSAPTPGATERRPKGETYAPAALPRVDSGPGRDVVSPDGTTKTVKAAPCSPYARETDGFTTCVGIPDQDPSLIRRRRH